MIDLVTRLSRLTRLIGLATTALGRTALRLARLLLLLRRRRLRRRRLLLRLLLLRRRLLSLLHSLRLARRFLLGLDLALEPLRLGSLLVARLLLPALLHLLELGPKVGVVEWQLLSVSNGRPKRGACKQRRAAAASSEAAAAAADHATAAHTGRRAFRGRCGSIGRCFPLCGIEHLVKVFLSVPRVIRVRAEQSIGAPAQQVLDFGAAQPAALACAPGERTRRAAAAFSGHGDKVGIHQVAVHQVGIHLRIRFFRIVGLAALAVGALAHQLELRGPTRVRLGLRRCSWPDVDKHLVRRAEISPLELRRAEISPLEQRVVKGELLHGPIEHALLVRATRHEPVDLHRPLLPNAVRARLALHVALWVPVGVEDDDCVGRRQVDALSARARREQEDEAGRVGLEPIDGPLARVPLDGAVDALVVAEHRCTQLEVIFE